MHTRIRIFYDAVFAAEFRRDPTGQFSPVFYDSVILSTHEPFIFQIVRSNVVEEKSIVEEISVGWAVYDDVSKKYVANDFESGKLIFNMSGSTIMLFHDLDELNAQKILAPDLTNVDNSPAHYTI